MWRVMRMFRRLPNSRQLMVIACVLFGFWCITLFRMSYITYQYPKESELLKSEIIRLSENYVRALARENADIVDGPYAGRFTAYDLKKTMAVLLESMLERLNRLEVQVKHVINDTSNSTLIGSPFLRLNSALHAEDIIQGKTEECSLTAQEKQLFPACEAKIGWMKEMWKSDPCYASFGVDGSVCSFVMYLSEVEGWCPIKAWRGNITPPKEDPSKIRYANISTDLSGLMKILVDPSDRNNYAWMRLRIERLWDRWVTAIKALDRKQDMSGRRKKKILVHMGLLSKKSGWKFAEMQFKGGPLGELVQWSDLISTLYILGHSLEVTSESEQLGKILAQLPSASSPCQSRSDLPVDIIYTDIVGLGQFKKHVKKGYGKFSCLLRIVDSFGTEPAYNLRAYAKAKKQLTSWGGHDLQPQQFFTMFPHSPDNSFMGFVVEQHLNDSSAQQITRKNQVLVYGKQPAYWKGKEDYLTVIKQFFDIHGTVYYDPHATVNKSDPIYQIPGFVNNHGLLSGEKLHYLLRESKVFVGLGFPYEGPAPLEAIASGCVFLNPKFDPPHSSRNNPFFKGKPTGRELSSQHPYAEQFIGEPYVYTLDINNLAQVRSVLGKIRTSHYFKPYMPYEFKEEGMLQRMNAYIEHQNFCRFQKRLADWPSASSITFLFGEADQSCKDVCWSKNLICEPSHFRDINSYQSISQEGVECQTEKSLSDIFFPAFSVDKQECIIQKEEMLFSCVGKNPYLQRLCPCRDYIVGQTALCRNCTT